MNQLLEEKYKELGISERKFMHLAKKLNRN